MTGMRALFALLAALVLVAPCAILTAGEASTAEVEQLKRDIEDLRIQMKSMRSQIAVPSAVDLRSLASKACRPVWIGHVDHSSAIAAKLAGEAQEQELLFPLIGSDMCLAQQIMPLPIRDMLIEQLLDLSAQRLSCRATSLGPLPGFLVFEFLHGMPEIRGFHMIFCRLRGPGRRGACRHSLVLCCHEVVIQTIEGAG